MKKIYLPFFIFICCSCTKNSFHENNQTDSILDSIYLYAQQVYLWNTQLPAYNTFNPEKYYKSDEPALSLYKDEIFTFSQYAINPQTGISYEYNSFNPEKTKYSTIIEDNSLDTDTTNINIDNNFGLTYATVGTNDLRLMYVDTNSPIGRAGFHRGDKIISINGNPAQTSDSYYSYITSCLQNSYIDVNIESDTSQTGKSVRIYSILYEPNPVLKSKIIQTKDKMYGFVAYSSFTNQDNSAKYLEPVLYDFASKGVTDLIIDLRYNGGGYQNTCIYFANNIIPNSLNNKVMFKEYYNSLMQSGGATILKNQPLIDTFTLYDIDYSVEGNTTFFQKEGILDNIKNVYFIVSKQTASASELLINVLKPYINVKLIGVSDDPSKSVKTYGKPVGFFDIDIADYKMYISMYQDKNANGEGDFFDGMAADYSELDDVTLDFGSENDPAINRIINNPKTALLPYKNKLLSRNFSSKVRVFNRNPLAPGLIKTKRDLEINLINKHR